MNPQKATTIRGILISPSGNLYGSEQVLLEYLQLTAIRWIVFVPPTGGLFQELQRRRSPLQQIKTYNPGSLTLFYLSRILPIILLTNRSVLYVHEGGHIRYIRTFAFFLFWKKFVVHLRLQQDAKRLKPGRPGSNVLIIAPEKFVLQHLPHPFPIVHLRDPCSMEVPEKEWRSLNKNHPIHLSIIGRIEKSKGSIQALEFIQFMYRECPEKIGGFHFFGHIKKEVRKEWENTCRTLAPFIYHHGFVTDKNVLYQYPVILHFGQEETFGRIFPEALDHYCFFLGPRSGGIAQTASLLGLENFLFNPDHKDWKNNLLQKLFALFENNLTPWILARKKAKVFYSPDQYSCHLDYIIQKKTCLRKAGRTGTKFPDSKSIFSPSSNHNNNDKTI